MAQKWQKWMPFHIDRFMGSRYVQAMHPAARSGYLYLLAAQWQSDGCVLSNDEEELAALSGLGVLWTEYSRAILRHFEVMEDGALRNEVLFEEWAEALRVFSARRKGAKATNERSADAVRAQSERSPSAVRAQSERRAHTQTQTQTQTVTETETVKQKPKATPLSEKSDGVRPAEFANSWNRLRGALPKVTQFTDSRKKKIQARQRQGISLAEFEKAVSKCASIPFLSGDNKQGWKSDFDWLIENDKNLLKVMEGKYETGNANENEALGDLIRQRRAESRVVNGDAVNGVGVSQAGEGSEAAVY